MAKFWIVGDGGEAITTSALLQLSRDKAGGCWWLCWAAWGLTSANRDGVWVSLTGAAVIAPSERQRREKFCQNHLHMFQSHSQEVNCFGAFWVIALRDQAKKAVVKELKRCKIDLGLCFMNTKMWKKCSYEDRDGLLIPGSGSTGSSVGHLRIISSLSHWQSFLLASEYLPLCFV